MINLTPHAISIKINDETITFEPSGVVARIETKEVVVNEINGIPVIKRELLQVVGLPDNDVPCIVSSMVLDAMKNSNRKNLFAPDTGNTAIRNERGHVVAVTRLVCN